MEQRGCVRFGWSSGPVTADERRPRTVQPYARARETRSHALTAKEYRLILREVANIKTAPRI